MEYFVLYCYFLDKDTKRAKRLHYPFALTKRHHFLNQSFQPFNFRPSSATVLVVFVLVKAKMANELDRVRISAAELRAEASNSVNNIDHQEGERKPNEYRKGTRLCKSQHI